MRDLMCSGWEPAPPLSAAERRVPVPPPLSAKVDLLFATHRGVLSAAALRAAGVAGDQIAEWCAVGSMRRCPGRLLEVPASVDEVTPLRAIALRYPKAVFAMETAAALHELDAFDEAPLSPPTVFVPGGGRLVEGRVVRRGDDLRPPDIVQVRGLRVTSVTRTIADLGAAVAPDLVERALESALRSARTTEEALWAACKTIPRTGRSGPRVLAAILRRRGVGTRFTDSDAETRFLQIVRHPRLAEPRRQRPIIVDGIRQASVDFAFDLGGGGAAARELWVEIDGALAHSGKQALVRDLRRQNTLMREQPILLRFPATDVYGSSAYVRQETWHHLGLRNRQSAG